MDSNVFYSTRQESRYRMGWEDKFRGIYKCSAGDVETSQCWLFKAWRALIGW